nr:hypothetical protein [Tanacetum cinerariifolium]
AEAADIQRQAQVSEGGRAEQRQCACQQPDAKAPHRARMASASTWSLAPRASGRRVRSMSNAASSCAP